MQIEGGRHGFEYFQKDMENHCTIVLSVTFDVIIRAGKSSLLD